MSVWNPEHERSSFRCPHCGDPRNGVIDSREIQQAEKIKRRRECVNKHRFSTIETIKEKRVYVPVIARVDLRLMEFSTEALRGELRARGDL